MINPFLILIAFVFSQHQTIVGKSAADHPDTLAVVDKKIITTDFYKKLYQEKITRFGLQDNYDVRLQFLNNLLNDEILLREALNRNYDKTPGAINELNRIKIQKLLNRFVELEISPEINITEEYLKDLFIKLNTKILVRHIYAETKEKADKIYKQIISREKTFEEAARENFKDAELKNNGGLLGYIAIDETDPEFEKAAFSLKPGEVSQPVKTVYGYSIIRVDDIKRNPLITENEYLKSLPRLKAFARKRIYEDSLKQFVRRLGDKLKVEFNEEALDRLYLLFNNSGRMEVKEKGNDDVVLISSIGKWKMNELLSELNSTPPRQLKWIKSKENLRDFLKGLVNRKYIIDYAKNKKYDQSDVYKREVQYEFETYLISSITEDLKKNIVIPEDSLESYYNKNREYFKTKPRVRISVILVDNENSASKIKNELNAGTPFEELALKYSIQKATAVNGGDAGYFDIEDLDYLADTLWNLNSEQWLGPFRDDSKFLFVKITDKVEPKSIPFYELKEDIKNMLVEMKWLAEKNNIIDSLKRNINIHVYKEKLLKVKI
jgi:parvulin-like peptidyl-prolyl isomerase